MSPRRNRQRRGDSPGFSGSGDAYGLERTESWQGEDWVVRPVAGNSGKHYRCPGCDQEIPPGVGHVVTWSHHGGVDDRRHWHSACWNARARRGAKTLRARNGPRH